MDAEIDPAEADEKDQARQKHGYQVGGGSVLHIPAAEKDDHAVKDQNGEGMPAREAVTALGYQMESKVGSGPLKGSLQHPLYHGRGNGGSRQGNAKGGTNARNQQEQAADQRDGLPVAQIGDPGQKGGEIFVSEAIDILTDHSVKNQRIPRNDEI